MNDISTPLLSIGGGNIITGQIHFISALGRLGRESEQIGGQIACQ